MINIYLIGLEMNAMISELVNKYKLKHEKVYIFNLKNKTGQLVYKCPVYFKSRKLCSIYASILSDHFNNSEIVIDKVLKSSLLPSYFLYDYTKPLRTEIRKRLF